MQLEKKPMSKFLNLPTSGSMNIDAGAGLYIAEFAVFATCYGAGTFTSILFLHLWQLSRLIVRLAVQLLHFLHEACAVISLGIRERPGLTFVIPVVRRKPLSLL